MTTAPVATYQELPFSLTPNPRYLHIGTQHRSAIAKSLYLVEHRQGLTVIYGDVGMGKTTVSRHLLHHFLDYPEKYAVAYLPNPATPPSTSCSWPSAPSSASPRPAPSSRPWRA